MLNGDGLRVVLWVAGCGHHCKGCQNPITWDPNGGIPFDDAAKAEIFEQLDKVINECNQYGNFLSQVFTITNVKELSAEEVEEIIKKNGGNSQASH